MKRAKELEELRRKDAQALLAALAREREQLDKEAIAVKLGKMSKVHELSRRRATIARTLTVLSEKLSSVAAPSVTKETS